MWVSKKRNDKESLFNVETNRKKFRNNRSFFIIFTNPSARAGSDTRSIFKRGLTGLNSDFSFSESSCLTKADEPSPPYYLPIAGGSFFMGSTKPRPWPPWLRYMGHLKKHKKKQKQMLLPIQILVRLWLLLRGNEIKYLKKFILKSCKSFRSRVEKNGGHIE